MFTHPEVLDSHCIDYTMYLEVAEQVLEEYRELATNAPLPAVWPQTDIIIIINIIITPPPVGLINFIYWFAKEGGGLKLLYRGNLGTHWFVAVAIWINKVMRLFGGLFLSIV